jgi:hypothetical protein
MGQTQIERERSRHWAFDIVEFFHTQFANPLGFALDEEQRYPDRITGTLYGGSTHNPTERRAVVIPKPVGYDNAGRYRRWVTLPPVHWENMTNRPDDWEHFILMVGLLPDGTVWWANLYNERILAEKRDQSEQVPGPSGPFYRFDPGLTSPALVAEWHKDKPGIFSDSPAVYEFSVADAPRQRFYDQAEFVAALWDHAASRSDEETVTGRIDVGGDRMAVHIG